MAEEMLGSTPYPIRIPAAQTAGAGALGRQAAQAAAAPTAERDVYRRDECRRGPRKGAVSSAATASLAATTAPRHDADELSAGRASPRRRDLHHRRGALHRAGPVGWLVHFEILEAGRELFGNQPLFVHARQVILAAGTLGSTEILLRSAEKGLPLSPALGQHFNGNADFWASLTTATPRSTASVPGRTRCAGREPVGPITSYIDLRQDVPLKTAWSSKKAASPGRGEPAAAAFGLAADVEGQPTQTSLWDRFKAQLRTLQSNLFGAYTGAVHNTQTYLVMGHDNDRGRMGLERDVLQVAWPGVGKVTNLLDDYRGPASGHRPLAGTYLKEPLWNHCTREQLITVHPLGGCVMADDASVGVVNDRGQVFRGSSGSEVHPASTSWTARSCRRPGRKSAAHHQRGGRALLRAAGF